MKSKINSFKAKKEIRYLFFSLFITRLPLLLRLKKFTLSVKS